MATRSSPVVAGPMVHHIERVLPRCGQRGTTVEVVIKGTFLKNPREILFFRPGIKAIEISPMEEIPRQSIMHGGWIGEQVRCKFEIAPDCPLGEHPFKVLTATELTTLSTFWVTPFPVVPEDEKGQNKNDSPATAKPVTRDATVYGRMDTGRIADLDLYKVTGKKGEHLSVEVVSVELTEYFYAGAEFDLMVRILDRDGRELARNDDSSLHIQDPLVSVLLPEDGDYYVEVRQRTFKPAGEIYYLAHIGNFIRPLAIYPAGGMPGQVLSARLLGDPQGVINRSISLPQKTGAFDWNEGLPSGMPMRVCNYPNVLEEDGGKETIVAQLPAALNGIIAAANEVDGYRLNVRKGSAYRVRVFARALGTMLDPRLIIRPANSETPEVVADDASHADRDLYGVGNQINRKESLDPSIVWEPKQDGEYILSLTDMRGVGDPTGVYRIEIEPTRDSVHTYLSAPVIDGVECPRLTGIVIPQGNRWTFNLFLAQSQGSKYNGELEIIATGIPEGVTMIAPRVKPGQKSVPIQFVATSDARPQAVLIELQAQPVDRSKTFESGSHQLFPYLSHSGGRAWHTVMVERYALAVTDPPPFTIELKQPEIPLSQSGELAMQVSVKLRPEFQEEIDFQFDWVPPGLQAQPTVTIPANESTSVLRLFATPSAQPEHWKMAVTASTTGGSYYLGIGRQRVSSAFVDVEVAEPYIALKNKPTSVRRGEKTAIVWDVEHKKPFPGSADAVLLGLPKGVAVMAPGPKLKVGDTQLAFEIEATDEALLGQYKELTCEIIVRQAGQEIRQRTGKGILRVDPALK